DFAGFLKVVVDSGRGRGHRASAYRFCRACGRLGAPMSAADVGDEGRLGKIDALLAAGLSLGYLCALLVSVKDLGYARDEGFYFQAARSYEAWLEMLLANARAAFEPQVVDRYW